LRHALAQPDDTGIGVEDTEAARARGRDQQPTVVGSQIESREERRVVQVAPPTARATDGRDERLVHYLPNTFIERIARETRADARFASRLARMFRRRKVGT
jgi:hypothetical protein